MGLLLRFSLMNPGCALHGPGGRDSYPSRVFTSPASSLTDGETEAHKVDERQTYARAFQMLVSAALGVLLKY